MDTATLVSALQHTLSPDKATRQQAEAALSQVRAARARCPSLPRRHRRLDERRQACRGLLLSTVYRFRTTEIGVTIERLEFTLFTLVE